MKRENYFVNLWKSRGMNKLIIGALVLCVWFFSIFRGNPLPPSTSLRNILLEISPHIQNFILKTVKNTKRTILFCGYGPTAEVLLCFQKNCKNYSLDCPILCKNLQAKLKHGNSQMTVGEHIGCICYSTSKGAKKNGNQFRRLRRLSHFSLNKEGAQRYMKVFIVFQ